MFSEQKTRALFRRLVKPAVAAGATLLALLMAEAVVRVVGGSPSVKPIQLGASDCVYKRSTNPILGFELKANCRSDDPDFIQTYERTNAHGQRDRDRTLQKPEGCLLYTSPSPRDRS